MYICEREKFNKNIFIEVLIVLIFNILFVYLCICVFYSKFLSFANLQRTNEHDVVGLTARHARMAAAISFSADE